MPSDPDRREAEERDDRAGEPREAEEPRGAAPERDRAPEDLFPWEEAEPEPGSGAGVGESGPDRDPTDRRGEPGEGTEAAEPVERTDAPATHGIAGTPGTGGIPETGDAEAPDGPGTAMPRPGHGLMSREKVLWEWPYPGDWIEEAPD